VTPHSFASSPVVYFDIAFASFRHVSYNMTLRNKQDITQGDFSTILSFFSKGSPPPLMAVWEP